MAMERYNKNIEEKWMNYWFENNIYRFDDSDDSKPLYIIDTPPPFTSGKLHMGHVLSYSLFDFAARYRRMKGYNVLYPQGWDCQGFPTEVKVEKKYGRLPREQFIQKCVEWTHEFIDKMRSQMKRMGFSADWSREYKTMDPEYHKKVQYSLIKMYGDGLVYRDSHPVFWCPHCRSAIAKAETEEIERDTNLNHLKFTVKDTGEDLIIATTRPEYLYACVGVFVHPEDDRYKHLVGKTVITPIGKEVKVYSDVDVEKDFGTGVVMVCTFGDKQDAVWVYRHNLPVIDAIDEAGRLKDAEEFTGMKLEDAKKKIIEKLKAEGKVVKIEPLHQVVKIHDRCKRPIELKVSKQWFCKVDGFQRDIIKHAKSMRWIPEFTQQYLIDWTNFIEWDWVISRQRYYGTPLPFYVCDSCGHTEAADEDELPFKPETARGKVCPKCGAQMKPETSVADVWVDSSITPLIIAGWPEPGWEKYYPATLRPQGIEIIRTWAFYTIYRTMILTGKAPFKELLLNGNVLGPDGKKMSKSLGNVVDPLELVDKYSADAVRLWAGSGVTTRDRPFNYQEMKHAQSFINKLWNASRFVERVTDDYEEGDYPLEITDRWILSRLEKTKKIVDGAYMNYEYYTAMTNLEQFFWHEFCDNYLEFVKHRVYGDDLNSKRAAQKTLRLVLLETLKMLAPIVAYTTEEIYNQIFVKGESPESIHRTKWPEEHPEYLDDEMELMGSVLVSVVSEIRKYKSSQKMSLKEEIDHLKLAAPEKDIPIINKLRDEISKIVHVKQLDVISGEGIAVIA